MVSLHHRWHVAAYNSGTKSWRVVKVTKATREKIEQALAAGVGVRELQTRYRISERHFKRLFPGNYTLKRTKNLEIWCKAHILLTEHGLSKRETAQALGKNYRSFLTVYSRYLPDVLIALPAWRQINALRVEAIKTSLTERASRTTRDKVGLRTRTLAQIQVWNQRTLEERRAFGLSSGATSAHYDGSGKQKIVTCPHCGTSGGSIVMRRYHFERCRQQEFPLAAE